MMKGLAAMLGAKGAKAPMAPDSEPAEEVKEAKSVGAKAFFKLASEASAAGDHDAAADAFESGVKACSGASYSKE